MELMNQARFVVGSRPLELVENAWLQERAEKALEECMLSNYGLDGLKPYMRNSLAGSYQSNQEIVSVIGYCSPVERVLWSTGESVVRDAMKRWRERQNIWEDDILGPWFRNVSVGLAWNDHLYAVHVQFEGDYITFDDLPTIGDDGELSLKGDVKNGARLRKGEDLLIDVYYDAPLGELTVGQLANTNCYTYGETGLLAAALRPPAPSGRHYVSDTLEIEYVVGCVDPYEVGANTRPPEEYLEIPVPSLRLEDGEADWVTARRWLVSNDTFSVSADLSGVIDKRGPGVYTIVVFAVAAHGEYFRVGTYSVFVGIPDAEDDVSVPEG